MRRQSVAVGDGVYLHPEVGLIGAARLLVEPAELISFVMSQRMLRGIKPRAERAVRCPATVALVPWPPTTPRPTADRP